MSGLEIAMRRTLAALFVLVASPALAQDAGDIRDLFRAPPRFAVHANAQVGDWLERATSTRMLTTRQKTTIVGVDRDAWVIEMQGPAWQGHVLRLVVDKATGKTQEAKAGPANKPEELRPIKLGDELAPPAEKEEGEEEIVVPAGAFKCKRMTSEQTGMARTRSFRFLALDGPRKGEVVKQLDQVWDGRAWHESIVFLVSAEDAVVETSGKKLACTKYVRRVSIDSVKQPDTSEWIAKEPLFFGEKLVKLETPQAATTVTFGQNGKSVLEPKDAPKPSAPPLPPPGAPAPGAVPPGSPSPGPASPKAPDEPAPRETPPAPSPH